jgi:YscD/CdsD-like Bon-like domain 3
MAADFSAVLVVESGVHQAARTVLATGLNQVGPSAGNDIVISDLRIHATSFTLELRGRSVTLHAADAPVEFPGRKSLECGESRRCAGGIRFTSSGIAFRLEISALSPGPVVSSTPSKFRSRMPVLATGVLGTIMLTVLVSLKAAPAIVQSDDAIETTGSIPTTSSRVVQSSGQRQLSALQSLRQHLATLELSSPVLTAEPDGSIEARGQILKYQEATWHEVMHWFDTSTNGQVVLVNAVSVAAEAQPLTIQAVWPGHNPYVIDGSGGKLFIGTALPSGWSIGDIDRSHVLLKRGDESLSVRF